ncbi:MAG: hypothetical protein HC786_17035 [Richelia sp. CSU_2_1]|nr:hypothetical protein [Microcoleus sp. SU_5_3]NJL67547.1 hypothetical protein [Microcoleus sp. SM1_3_4]NJR23731.1 hypothetical protein [Richelia sp. CSU_2_1]
MKKLKLSQARAPLSDYLAFKLSEPYIVTKNDRPLILTVDGELAAVLMPIRDADMETVSLSLNPDFIAMLQESKARLKTEGGISLEQLKQELSELV